MDHRRRADISTGAALIELRLYDYIRELEDEMLYQIQSSRPLTEIESALQDSASRNKFGVIAVLNLQEIMKKKGVELAMEGRVFEVCNPHQAKKVLESEGAVSTALP